MAEKKMFRAIGETFLVGLLEQQHGCRFLVDLVVFSHLPGKPVSISHLKGHVQSFQEAEAVKYVVQAPGWADRGAALAQEVLREVIGIIEEDAVSWGMAFGTVGHLGVSFVRGPMWLLSFRLAKKNEPISLGENPHPQGRRWQMCRQRCKIPVRSSWLARTQRAQETKLSFVCFGFGSFGNSPCTDSSNPQQLGLPVAGKVWANKLDNCHHEAAVIG